MQCWFRPGPPSPPAHLRMVTEAESEPSGIPRVGMPLKSFRTDLTGSRDGYVNAMGPPVPVLVLGEAPIESRFPRAGWAFPSGPSAIALKSRPVTVRANSTEEWSMRCFRLVPRSATHQPIVPTARTPASLEVV